MTDETPMRALSIEDAARLLERKYGTANLWKVGIGEQMSTITEWMWIVAPDLAAAARTADEWLEATGWKEDSPLVRVVAAELVSDFVLASGNVTTSDDSIEWDVE
jgi:hypothetical protein